MDATMKTEDAGDYGGTCDTCANGVAKAGHTQCPFCEKQAAEVDAHIDEMAGTDLAIKVLEDYQWDKLTTARERAAEYPDLAGECLRDARLLQDVIDTLTNKSKPCTKKVGVHP